MRQETKKKIRSIAKYAPTALFLLILQPQIGPLAMAFDSDKSSFALKFKNLVSPYEEMSVFVLPKETLLWETALDGKNDEYEVKASDGQVVRLKPHSWRWQAPAAKGLYRIKVTNSTRNDSITLKAFVMVPYSELKGGFINGYRIDNYPSRPLKNNPIYQTPAGFVEVTKDNENVDLTPHFELKQFLSKQAAGYPKYVVLDERLLLKLESILERVNESGFSCESLHVMSGYRTPFYNKAIKNVTYSLHQWGRAADVFVDRDKNGLMDDLNKDRKIDKQDAVVFQSIVEGMYRGDQNQATLGGLGLYDSTAAHGPFVHVDVRGRQARWSS